MDDLREVIAVERMNDLRVVIAVEQMNEQIKAGADMLRRPWCKGLVEAITPSPEALPCPERLRAMIEASNAPA